MTRTLQEEKEPASLWHLPTCWGGLGLKCTRISSRAAVHEAKGK